MRSIFFDELLKPEVEAVAAYLGREARPSGLENLFWLPLPTDLWNDRQKTQADQGRSGEAVSFRFAVELGPEWVRFELFLRSEGLRDIGGTPADARQSLFLLTWADEMARNLNLVSCAPPES